VPLVSITLFLPLLGAAVVLVLRLASARAAHTVGLATAGLTVLGALGISLRGVGPVHSWRSCPGSRRSAAPTASGLTASASR
jgi:hypothetical protein